jgi:radical SAM protein with 4Fe4S-binding SPASM domain
MGFLYSLNRLKQRLFLRNIFLLYNSHKIPPPSYVVWDSTKLCNLKCVHCDSEDLGCNELDLIEITTILDQLAAAGVRRLQVTGGEPLLREDLFRILHHAVAKKFTVSLASNGFFIDEEKADLITKAGVSLVQISLDGPAEIHNAIRGDSESYYRAVNAIEILKTHPHVQVGVSTTVMPRNLAALSELQAVLVPLKVDFWSLGIVMPSGKAKNNPELFLNPTQFISVMNYVKETRRKMRVEFVENFTYLGKFDSQIRNSPKLCPAGILSCCIGVDGWLRGCPDQEDNSHFREGYLQQDDFMDIWQRAFRRYRNQDLAKNDIRCRLCTDLEKCRGGCWVMREQSLHCYQDYIS